MTLGQKIKEARRRAGLSQEQLAQQLIISRSAIARWEADLGTPDIGNLKVLSRALDVSIDHLLEYAPHLQQARSIGELSARTYCGKTCHECTTKEALGCSGCKQFPHEEMGGCVIARCCKEKHLVTCCDCGYRENCNKLRHAAEIPHQRLQTQQRHSETHRQLTEKKQAEQQWISIRAPGLCRGLWALFALTMLTDALSILSLLTVALRAFDFLSAARLPLVLLCTVSTLLCAGCCFFLASICVRYRAAAWPRLVAAPFALLTSLLLMEKPAALWFLAPQLPALVLFFLSQHRLLQGHASVTEAYAPDLSHCWRKLWSWQAASLMACGFPFCGLFLLAIPVLGYWIYGGMVSLLPGFLLAVECRQLYLLFRTARLFGHACHRPQ